MAGAYVLYQLGLRFMHWTSASIPLWFCQIVKLLYLCVILVSSMQSENESSG